LNINGLALSFTTTVTIFLNSSRSNKHRSCCYHRHVSIALPCNTIDAIDALDAVIVIMPDSVVTDANVIAVGDNAVTAAATDDAAILLDTVPNLHNFEVGNVTNIK
jgi:hypothetical protein